MTITDVNVKMFRRYFKVIKDSKLSVISGKSVTYWFNFIDLAINDDLTEDKQSRWLGFIQGVLFTNGLIDIEKERKYSRPLYQRCYNENGIVQKTVSVPDDMDSLRIGMNFCD